jgi:hypothetical protein
VKHLAHGANRVNFMSCQVTAVGVPVLYIVHAVLMSAGAGVLLPLGVAFARFGRNHQPTTGPNAWWFIHHQIIQYVGTACVLAGFAVAIYMKGGNHFTHLHERLGLAVVIAVVLQPLNALIRPSAAPPLSRARRVWSVAHRALGYGVLVLAAATIFYGLRLLGVQSATTLSVVYIIVFGCMCVGFIVTAAVVAWLAHRTPQPAGDKPASVAEAQHQPASP